MKDNFEHMYELYSTNKSVVLVFGDLVAHNRGDELIPPPVTLVRFLFGDDLNVIKFSNLPSIGFVNNIEKTQEHLFLLCQKYNPNLTNFGGNTLSALVPLHGPPSYKEASPCPPYYNKPLWSLQYRIAIGSNMPDTKIGHTLNLPKSDIVKEGWLTKADPDGKNWKKRYVKLWKDARLTYHESPEKLPKGYVDLYMSNTVSIDIPGNPFAFQTRFFRDFSTRQYSFCASSQVDKDDWIDKIIGQFKACYADLGLGVEELLKSSKKLEDVFPQDHGERPWANEKDDVKKVLNFWLNFIHSDAELKSNTSFWFFRSNVVDCFIQKEFSSMVDRAIAGEYEDWLTSPYASIALIILLDQFPRNIYREHKESFKGDKKSLFYAQKILDSHICDKLPCYIKFWLSFPFQRSEDLESFNKSRPYLEIMFKESGQQFFEFGIKNCDNLAQTLKEYGRFPNRNKMLGRESTSKEKAYLKSNKIKSF